MLFFIPAWYQQGAWRENEQSWYKRRTHTEYDDTVKQVQLFHRSGDTPYRILLLSYAPNLRHFLHRQSLLRASCWSCFDSICEIRRSRAALLSFHQLSWPENVEFVYSFFLIQAYIDGKLYAQVDFGEDGNLIGVEMFQNGRISRKNYYDDRGFVSSTVVYENGEPVYEEYLMENGQWKLREDRITGEVTVNPVTATYTFFEREKERKYQFSRMKYSSMRELIEEVFTSYVSGTQDNDIFCIAADPMHNQMLFRVLSKRKTLLSFYSSRYYADKHPEDWPFIEAASYLVTDSIEQTDKLRRQTGLGLERIQSISPFDTRIEAGISQQIHRRMVLVPVEGLHEDEWEDLLENLAAYLEKNEDVDIHFLTRSADINIEGQLLSRAESTLERLDKETDWATNSDCQRFFVEQCVDERMVTKCLRMQRLLVDPRPIPDLYLQINCISAGIPQIVLKETPYLRDGENGRVISSFEEIPEAMAYYLDELGNWNEAMVNAISIAKDFTTQHLLEQWKEVIREVE